MSDRNSNFYTLFDIDMLSSLLCYICIPICPISKIVVAIKRHITLPYMPSKKKEITGKVARARGIPKKLL